MVAPRETVWEPKAIASLLRGLAIDVELNPHLAARVGGALAAMGLLAPEDGADQAAPDPANGDLPGLYAARLDLIALFRQGGEEHVRARLATLDLAGLRRVIQAQHLDPQRLTQRLRSVAKLTDFIVERVGALVERERELARSASWML